MQFDEIAGLVFPENFEMLWLAAGKSYDRKTAGCCYLERMLWVGIFVIVRMVVMVRRFLMVKNDFWAAPLLDRVDFEFGWALCRWWNHRLAGRVGRSLLVETYDHPKR